MSNLTVTISGSLSPTIFPLTIPVSNQATYTLSNQEFSDLVHCDPKVKKRLSNEFFDAIRGKIQLAFQKKVPSHLTDKECLFYNHFGKLLEVVTALPAQGSMEEAMQSFNIGSIEDRFLTMGIVCDQMKNEICKIEGSVAPKFFYAGNKFFKIYQGLKEKGKIKDFKGDFIKDRKAATQYLNRVTGQAKAADMHSILKVFEKGEAVIEDRGNGVTNIRKRRDDEM